MSAISRAIMTSACHSPVLLPTPSDLPSTAYSFLNRMLADTNGAAEVYHVTNLNTSGAGSFRDAIEGGSSAVTRVVVFDVSGVCNVGPYTAWRTNRSNLFVAGETAPDPGDGSGRGFHLRGAGIRCTGKNVVFRHITCQPGGGAWLPDSYSDNEGIRWWGHPDGFRGASRGFMLVNCSIHGSTDEATVIKPGETSGQENQILGGAGYIDCMLPAALNARARDVYRDGANPANNKVQDGHSYGPMVGYGSFGILYLRNLIIGAVERGPQFGGSCDGLVVNNLVFNHGKAIPGTNNSTNLPFIVDARTNDGTDAYSPHTFTKVGYISNYIEAAASRSARSCRRPSRNSSSAKASTAVAEIRPCRHCGTPFSAETEDEQFCCSGCAHVQSLIGERGLDRFYSLRGKEIEPVSPATTRLAVGGGNAPDYSASSLSRGTVTPAFSLDPAQVGAVIGAYLDPVGALDEKRDLDRNAGGGDDGFLRRAGGVALQALGSLGNLHFNRRRQLELNRTVLDMQDVILLVLGEKGFFVFDDLPGQDGVLKGFRMEEVVPFLILVTELEPLILGVEKLHGICRTELRRRCRSRVQVTESGLHEARLPSLGAVEHFEH